ncbi:MAG TPA: DUF3592 domain-containing protein [Verrucomicrobiae bacterium]
MKALKRLFSLLVGAVVGIVLIYFGFTSFRESKALQSKGKTVSAEVTGGEERSGRRGRKKYYLEIAYKTEKGETQTSRDKVSRSVYEQGESSRKVNVVYLPEKPAVHRIGDKVSTEYGNILFGLAIIGFTGFSAISGGGSEE